MADSLDDAERAFDSAVALLDAGEGAKGEALLELVVSAARTAGDRVLLARALCVLGEWLHGSGRTGEALPPLREVVALGTDAGDAVAYESARARRLLDDGARREREPG
jgi:hypothetical protein